MRLLGKCWCLLGRDSRWETHVSVRELHFWYKENLERSKEKILRKSKARSWFLLWLILGLIWKWFLNTFGSQFFDTLGYGKRFKKMVRITVCYWRLIYSNLCISCKKLFCWVLTQNLVFVFLEKSWHGLYHNRDLFFSSKIQVWS